MPQVYQVTFDPGFTDIAGDARTDGYTEVISTLGYGRMVVTPEVAAELVALGTWTEWEPE